MFIITKCLEKINGKQDIRATSSANMSIHILVNCRTILPNVLITVARPPFNVKCINTHIPEKSCSSGMLLWKPKVSNRIPVWAFKFPAIAKYKSNKLFSSMEDTLRTVWRQKHCYYKTMNLLVEYLSSQIMYLYQAWITICEWLEKPH